MAFMSFAEYAKHRKVSKVAVTLAVKEGRITTVIGPNGKPGIDPEVADKQWEANSQPREKYQSPKIKKMAQEEVEKLESEIVNAIEPTLSEDDENLSYNDARTKKEKLQAKLLQLKYDELSGKLVPVDDVIQNWSDVAIKIKNKILGAASKLKQRHPEISLEVYATLEAIHREALDELANETNPEMSEGAE